MPLLAGMTLLAGLFEVAARRSCGAAAPFFPTEDVGAFASC